MAIGNSQPEAGYGIKPPPPSYTWHVTWDQIADEQRRSALLLLARKKTAPRAICSRAYYAVYALLAGRAPTGMTFPHGWSNPHHSEIPGIVDHCRGVPKSEVKRAVRRLERSRISADYGVGQTVNASEARERVRDCAYVFREVAGR